MPCGPGPAQKSPGFLAAQVFVIAAETGWPGETICLVPPARLARYRHRLLRRNASDLFLHLSRQDKIFLALGRQMHWTKSQRQGWWRSLRFAAAFA